MVQLAMFSDNGTPTPEAQASAVGAACSAEALDKVDADTLRRLVEAEYKLFPSGAIADDVLARLKMLGERFKKLEVHTIRSRESELKTAEYGCVLVEAGRRKTNTRGNSCAVIIHRQFKEAV